MVVGEEERAVANDRGVAAERHRAAATLDGERHVAAQQSRAVEDVERILATDTEGDGQGDEVHEVDFEAKKKLGFFGIIGRSTCEGASCENGWVEPGRGENGRGAGHNQASHKKYFWDKIFLVVVVSGAQTRHTGLGTPPKSALSTFYFYFFDFLLGVCVAFFGEGTYAVLLKLLLENVFFAFFWQKKKYRFTPEKKIGSS